jgi:hypothetical protein
MSKKRTNIFTLSLNEQSGKYILTKVNNNLPFENQILIYSRTDIDDVRKTLITKGYNLQEKNSEKSSK